MITDRYKEEEKRRNIPRDTHTKKGRIAFEIFARNEQDDSSQLRDPKWQYINEEHHLQIALCFPLLIKGNFIESRAWKQRGTVARFIRNEITQLIGLARGEQKWKSKA